MDPKKWSVDVTQQLAAHESGLKVRLAKGEVIDIIEMPKGMATRDLPKMLSEAATAYAALGNRTPPPPAAPEPPPTSGPRKAKLSLKKRS